ncbi:MAG: hypothetical protein QNJ54_13395 [Prochloraceae cyanobacterium]|nr:hypothetical protein [Prochloraceae cyanobacterium]
MKKLFIGVSIVSLVFLYGCSSWRTSFSRTVSDVSNRNANIICYSGGKLIFSSETDGKVISEQNSDGYVFINKKTGKLTEVSGDCVIKYK